MLQRLQFSGSRAVILIRLMVGIVFLSEGIQKFLYPAEQGAGRFAKIGIPSPALMGPFVGVAEIVCGILILTGFFIRFAAAVMLINISVALLSTKLPILLGRAGALLAPEAPAVRRLELAARGARGSLYVARGALPDPGVGKDKSRAGQGR
jgi:DoxX